MQSEKISNARRPKKTFKVIAMAQGRDVLKNVDKVAICTKKMWQRLSRSFHAYFYYLKRLW